ncbi:MAG: UbiX family flavin prenyltransferase [Nitrospinaceae bacterium]|nr:UbiX family flavin prenyltransferase [Nitrospinaceae bacterium]NIR57470.1 UbiX family flavin prenyltransferase [Nitrospinaceae bacterium]NIS87937.1 UbiX family flavin prenyltransferase [Nitrospinaceae bacterium]NIT84805.1 UbiX family flavin prenyltransferase [Nitrospinaceae bacterium]NIU46981.1 UbiX family flavin prenyltransferase [Nitrospinaceae bacterium]
MKRFVIAITGASGVCYAKRLFDVLQPQAELHLIISERGGELLNLELGLTSKYFAKENVTVHKNSKINASIASGSFPVDGMVVIPASMGTLGRIAAGTSESLIERAADVALKERNQLILVPRETPFSQIHLKNMLTLDRAGAMILPANPGFYQNPKSVDDLVDFVVARVLDQLNVAHHLTQPYKPE